MEFCPKCGSRLILKKKKTENEIEFVLVCRKGDYTKEVAYVSSKPPVANHENSKKMVTIISRNEQKLKTLSTIKVECPKCENKKAYIWQVQTRGLDESSTQFMRCTKCNHTFREST